MALLVALAALVAAGAAEASQEKPPRLVIRTVISTNQAVYTEGAVAFVAVDDLHGHTLAARRIDKRLALALHSGRFRLRSWVRPCDGNCGYLDPPTDRCSHPFGLRRGDRLLATIRMQAGDPCRISLHRT